MSQVEVLEPSDYAGFGASPLERSQMERAVYGLLQGVTMTEAARLADVTERTLYRWKKTPEWRETVATAQAEVIGAARIKLIGMAARAVRKLDTLLDDASGKGAPTEAAIAWGILDRVGVEVQAQQAEGVRRILTRVPRELPSTTPAPVQQEPAEDVPPPSQEDRPAIRIITRH